MGMALSTQPSSPAAALRVNAAASTVCAVVCVASAGVHGVLVVPHAHESIRLAVAFAVCTVAFVAASVALTVSPGPLASGAAAALLVAVAAAYVASRTSGIPGLVDDPEELDPVGVVISCLEVVGAVAGTRRAAPLTGHRAGSLALLAGVALVAALAAGRFGGEHASGECGHVGHAHGPGDTTCQSPGLPPGSARPAR
jgi:hypothetical protein